MQLQDSPILRISLSKIHPFVLMFGFYLFAYGANFPGGGFQAGVLFGTIVVVIELVFEQKIFPDRLYGILEAGGAMLLICGVWYGILTSGVPFTPLYTWQHDSFLLSNILIFLLGFAIFLEVSGSLVLIFRHFLSWGFDE